MVLGIEVYADGQVRYYPETLRSLISGKRAFWKFWKWNKRYLKNILAIGYGFFLQRPLSSVFDQVYKAKHVYMDLFRLADSARMNLRVL